MKLGPASTTVAAKSTQYWCYFLALWGPYHMDGSACSVLSRPQRAGTAQATSACSTAGGKACQQQMVGEGIICGQHDLLHLQNPIQFLQWYLVPALAVHPHSLWAARGAGTHGSIPSAQLRANSQLVSSRAWTWAELWYLLRRRSPQRDIPLCSPTIT